MVTAMFDRVNTSVDETVERGGVKTIEEGRRMAIQYRRELGSIIRAMTQNNTSAVARKLDKAQVEMFVSENEMAALKKNFRGTLPEQKKRLENTINAQKQELISVKNRLLERDNEIKRQADEISAAANPETAGAALRKHVKKLETDLGAKRAKIDELVKTAGQNELVASNEIEEAHEKQVAALEKTVASGENEVANLREQVNAAKKELDEQQKQREKAEDEHKAKIAKLESDFAEAQQLAKAASEQRDLAIAENKKTEAKLETKPVITPPAPANQLAVVPNNPSSGSDPVTHEQMGRIVSMIATELVPCNVIGGALAVAMYNIPANPGTSQLMAFTLRMIAANVPANADEAKKEAARALTKVINDFEEGENVLTRQEMINLAKPLLPQWVATWCDEASGDLADATGYLHDEFNPDTAELIEEVAEADVKIETGVEPMPMEVEEVKPDATGNAAAMDTRYRSYFRF